MALGACVSAAVGCGGGSSKTATGGNGGQAPTTGQGGSAGGHTGTGTGGHVATGTGGTTAGGPFTTSVPAGTKLTALTPAQETQLCNDIAAYEQGTVVTALCKEEAFTAALFLYAFSSPTPSDADLQAACTAAYTSCLNPDGGATTKSDCTSNEPATCQATVGDVKTCLQDSTSAYQAASASIPSCGTLTGASVAAAAATGADAGAGPTSPASCTKFDSTCNQMTSM
ncbi:MAG: hypothetical protein ACJ8F1_02275 [Polyangia bacterium]